MEPWQLPLVNEKLDISAGSYSYFQLPIQTGANLSFRVTVLQGDNRDINVWLLDLDNFPRFSNRGKEAFNYYIASLVTYENTFKFIAPKTGNYYLIIDNQFSVITGKTVQIYATVEYPGQENQNNAEKITKVFQNVYSSLKNMFVFSDFDIYSKHCGQVNWFGGPGGITICYELIEVYYRFDSGKFGELETWVFFHELGHTLLYLWGYPLWDNEDVADEFATVLLLMGGALKLS